MLQNPYEITKAAIEAVLLDLVGFEVEDYHEHIVWLAFCETHLIPEEIEDIIDYETIRRQICNELFVLAYPDATQDDLDIFWFQLREPLDVRSFATQKRINLERFCKERISRRKAPVSNATEALHIVHQIGADAPKYFDALKYIVGGAEDVTASMLENTLDMIDQVCSDLSIELDEKDGVKDYDIDTLIDKVTALANE